MTPDARVASSGPPNDPDPAVEREQEWIAAETFRTRMIEQITTWIMLHGTMTHRHEDVIQRCLQTFDVITLTMLYRYQLTKLEGGQSRRLLMGHVM